MGRLSGMAPRVGGLPARVAAPPKVADNFYGSPEWRALKAVKRREGYWCARCGAGKDLILDHIVERRDGGADLDPGNTEWLCRPHHQQKTAKAQKRRAQGNR